MHHLPLLLLTFISFTGFGQVSRNAVCYHNTPACRCSSGEVVQKGAAIYRTPDTLRALILVTLSTTRQGIAHARVGYVVLGGEKVIYLDCRKRPLKLPAKGWGWEVVGGKEK